MTLLSHMARALAARLGRPSPIYAHYGVTHRCNMRCRMCVVWKSANPERELTPGQADQLAGNLHGAGVRTIALGGGEPFVRKDLPELIRCFSRRHMSVRVLTNGIQISDEQLQAAVNAGMEHVSISLDTLDPEKEKQIYDGHDVWNDIVESMKRFRRHLTSPHAVPVMNVCVSRLNITELPDLVTRARELGFFCSFVPISLSPSEDNSDGFAAVAPDLAIREEDHAAVAASYNRLLELKQQGAPIANSSRFLRDSEAFLRTGSAHWHCDAGSLYLSVSPEGDVSICHHYPAIARFDVPNLGKLLREESTCKLAKEQRQTCPGCMRPCWAEVTHAIHHLPSSFEALRTMRGGGE